jgi:hypothetical protein
MGFLDRLRGREHPDDDAPPEVDAAPLDASEDAMEPMESVSTRPPTPEEEAELEEARTRYAARGIDPSDLASIAAAYDQALEEAAHEGTVSECVTVLATAIGDHLTGHGYRWVVSTDPFGTDLAVEPPRRKVPVVVHSLVAVRWMQRESGWVEPVVTHLATAGSR